MSPHQVVQWNKQPAEGTISRMLSLPQACLPEKVGHSPNAVFH